jgi:hypothetical protein
MIVQPDFLTHPKTKKFKAFTGDPASPLCLIRLWAHCQSSRKWEFPDIDKYDLVSICEWENQKISCEKALVACRWIEKMSGGGYRVRNFDKWNKNLINNWERNLSGKPKDEKEADPAGTPRATPPMTQLEESNPKNPIQSEEQEESNPTRRQSDPSGTSAPVRPSALPDGLDGGVSFSGNGNGGSDGWTDETTRKLYGFPNLEEALTFGQSRYAEVWEHAEVWVRAWYKTMSGEHWLDRKGQRIANWENHLASYCDVAWRGMNGASENRRRGKKPYVPNLG